MCFMVVRSVRRGESKKKTRFLENRWEIKLKA
jgi:hypothetical protein